MNYQISFAKNRANIKRIGAGSKDYTIYWYKSVSGTATAQTTNIQLELGEEYNFKPLAGTSIRIKNGSENKYFCAEDDSSGWGTENQHQLFWGWVQQEGGARWNSY